MVVFVVCCDEFFFVFYYVGVMLWIGDYVVDGFVECVVVDELGV